MKSWLPAFMILLAMTTGCKKASFESVDNKDINPLTGTGAGTGDSLGGLPSTLATGDLIVQVPVSELPAGGRTTQATAKMRDGTYPVVDWTVTASSGKTPGTIDSNGIYTSPTAVTDPYPVVISAALKSNRNISSSVPLIITPENSVMNNGLGVTIPVPQLLIGGSSTTAVAILKDGTKNPVVTWSVTGPAGKVIGSIDAKTGVYTSPLSGTEKFSVVITAVLNSDSTIKGSAPLLIAPDPKASQGIVVTIPVPMLAVGGKTTTAVATLKDGTKNPAVTWSITPISGKDVGKIGTSGIYTSPLSGTEQYKVEIVATLNSNPTVKGSTSLLIIPASKSTTDLIVNVPISEIKIGSNKTTAIAVLKDGTKNPPVTWSVSSSDGKAPGTIDANGVYTSPATGTMQYTVIITGALKSDPSVKDSASLVVVPLSNPNLLVSVPSLQIKIGGNQLPASAVLSDGTKNPPVIWKVTAANGKDPGTIDANGIYTSPKTGTGTVKYPIIITAVLKSDANTMSSVPLDVIPNDAVFARCTKANVVFPIVADVYELPANTSILPTNWKAQKFATTVCMDQYNVPEREFTSGFPDVPNLFEWFGLNTRTTINVPDVASYDFRLTSDDGSKMWIDNILVINNDGAHETTAKVVTLNIQSSGIHSLTLDYFQGPRYKISLILEWKRTGEPDSKYVVVPTSAFK